MKILGATRNSDFPIIQIQINFKSHKRCGCDINIYNRMLLGSEKD